MPPNKQNSLHQFSLTSTSSFLQYVIILITFSHLILLYLSTPSLRSHLNLLTPCLFLPLSSLILVKLSRYYLSHRIQSPFIIWGVPIHVILLPSYSPFILYLFSSYPLSLSILSKKSNHTASLQYCFVLSIP